MGNNEQEAALAKLHRQIALLEEEKSELVKRVRDLSVQGKEKASLIKNLFDYLPNGVVMFDQNRKVIQLNQATANIFSKQKRDLIGKSCTELFHCYEKNMSCPVLDQDININKLRTESHGCGRLILRSAVMNQDGASTVVVESLVDITELENATREKTLALQTKSNFLANVSHELRTPMHGILGCSNLLSSKVDEMPDKFQIYLETLDASASRLWSLIEKLFEASNLEEDSVKLQLTDFELGRFFKELEDDFRMSVDGYKNEVTFYHESAQLRVVTDPIRLHQIVITLLENATKYTEKGQIECDSQIVETADRTILKISVKDTGIGIDNKHLQSVFNLFEQEDGDTARKYQGAGLGLAIAQQLAQLMGGEILLESEPGKGSTFTLMLPVDVKT